MGDAAERYVFEQIRSLRGWTACNEVRATIREAAARAGWRTDVCHDPCPPWNCAITNPL